MTESITLDGVVRTLVNGCVTHIYINGRRTSRGRTRDSDRWKETLHEFELRVQKELDADKARLAHRHFLLWETPERLPVRMAQVARALARGGTIGDRSSRMEVSPVRDRPVRMPGTGGKASGSPSKPAKKRGKQREGETKERLEPPLEPVLDLNDSRAFPALSGKLHFGSTPVPHFGVWGASATSCETAGAAASVQQYVSPMTDGKQLVGSTPPVPLFGIWGTPAKSPSHPSPAKTPPLPSSTPPTTPPNLCAAAEAAVASLQQYVSPVTGPSAAAVGPTTRNATSAAKARLDERLQALKPRV